MEERADSLVVELIRSAALAGAYGALARELPEAAGGLTKMRRKHSGRVAALADELCAGRVEGPARTQLW